MEPYLICCDLDPQEDKYLKFSAAIKSLSKGNYWNELKSIWIVITEMDTLDIRTEISRYLNKDSKLFIIGLNTDAAWIGLSEESKQWLCANLRKYGSEAE